MMNEEVFGRFGEKRRVLDIIKGRKRHCMQRAQGRNSRGAGKGKCNRGRRKEE